MSLETPDRVCYINCNFCNTILAVSVPCNNMSIGLVTVRCGHCANLLYVNIGAMLQTNPIYNQHQKQLSRNDEKAYYDGSGSASFRSLEPEAPRTPAVLVGAFPSHPLWSKPGGNKQVK